MRAGRAVPLLVVAALLTAAAPAVAPDSPTCEPRRSPPVADLTLTGAEIEGRLRTFSFDSAALGRSAGVRVLLPEGYDASGQTRYPVLYLLHGHGGSHVDWTADENGRGAVEQIAREDWVVVMPDGGDNGWYSDWYGLDVDGHTPPPAPGWETFHLDELIPFVDATFPTIADREGRAIAGLSMGGFGAMSYAARHPDLFAAAGSFSGAVHPDRLEPAGPLGTTVASNLPDGQPPDSCIWGDPITQAVRWHDHDPTELAGNLDGLFVYLRTGNGVPGRHDAEPNPGRSLTENGVWQMNHDLHQALDERDIDHVFIEEDGTHHWPYWNDALADFLAHKPLRKPSPAAPKAAFSYRSAAPTFTVWGWAFDTGLDDATEFLYLDDVNRRGLDLRGSGTVQVTTASLFDAGETYLVTGSGPVVADADGRLGFEVDLGPQRPTQQYAFGPAAEATFTHVRVDIGPASGCRPLPPKARSPHAC